jgi:hypothetical protein
MATRSNIAILNEDGTVTRAYAHWDGYPSNNGRLLISHYNDPAKVRALICAGDVMALEPTIEDSRIDPCEPEQMPAEHVLSGMQEYLYLFDPSEGTWSYSDHGAPLRPLTRAVCGL